MAKKLFTNFNNIFHNFNHTVGYLIFKKIFLRYIFIVSILATYQIFSEYQQVKDEKINDLKLIGNLFYDDLKNSLINNNREKINKILNTVYNEKLISAVAFTFDKNQEKIFLKKEQINSKDFLKYNFSFFDSSLESKRYLANLELFLNKKIVIQEAKKSISLILISILFSVMIFWILAIAYTNIYLTIPLKKLLNGIREFENHEEERSHIKLQLNNLMELTILADSFNKMSSKISEDIINLRQLTMIQNSQKKALEQANRAKDDFLANMSHELKTPLNSINLISTIMLKNRDNKFNEKEIKNLEIIKTCGNDLLFLINDVLDISKLEAGKLELYYETIDAKKLIYEIKEMFEPQILEKNLDFVFKLDDKIDLIYSDKQRIKQIIKNLLSNSLKFVHEGSIRFLVKDKEQFIEIEISDEGIGIQEDKLETIFDRFKQVDGSTTRKYGGTGLGLAICKDLVQLFKGDIKIKSKLNEGTTVTVLIPKNLDKVNQDEIEKQKEIQLLKDNPKQKKTENNYLFEQEEKKLESFENKKSICILNNEPINYMALIIELNKKYRVEQSSNIKDFLEKIKNSHFDLYIVDMECLSKEQFKKYIEIKEEKKILVSKEILEEENFIKKPFDKNQMLSLISKELNG